MLTGQWWGYRQARVVGRKTGQGGGGEEDRSVVGMQTGQGVGNEDRLGWCGSR